MDANTIAIVVAIAGVGAVLTGIGVTVLIFLFRGFFRLGQLFQRMDAQDESIRQTREDMREMRDDVRQLRDNISDLTAAINQTNQMVIAIANHRHGQDGNIVFTWPAQPVS